MTFTDLSKPLPPAKLRPLAQVKAIILHTTGYGPGVARLDAQAKRGLVADVGEAFALRQRDVLRFRPHFLVGRDGAIFQILPLGATALHTGSGNMERLDAWPIRNERKVFVDRDGWQRLFTTHHAPAATPRDLPLWPSPNAVSVGVDLLESQDRIYPKAQLLGLVATLAMLGRALGLGPGAVFTHSMVDPIERTDARGRAWDLRPDFDLQTILDAFQKVAEKTTPPKET